MKMATKQEIIKEMLPSYRGRNKKEKSAVLDELEKLTLSHRQALIRRLNNLCRTPLHHVPKKRGPKPKYGNDVTAALSEVWNVAGNVCAERLHPILKEYVRILIRDKVWCHGDLATGLLCAMSLGTMKDRLEVLAKKSGAKGRSSTRPSHIKEIVPIRTGAWENPLPGVGEADSVAHCGMTLKGDYAYTIQYTDVCLIWTLLEAQWNKGMEATKESLVAMRSRCPFTIVWFDFDSGTEFINDCVIASCAKNIPPIKVTRTRPYRKNDHARIEQKQYSNIRRWVGYHRFDIPIQVDMLNEFYAVLEDYINFFLPSLKCLSKERVGSKYRRTYEEAKTAYRRAIEHPAISADIKERLKKKYDTLSPKVLKQKIDALQKKLFASIKRKKLQ